MIAELLRTPRGTGAGNPYEPIVEERQTQGGSQSPSVNPQMLQQFMNGGEAAGAAGSLEAAPSAGAYLESIGVPAAAAQSGGASGAGAMASAGPWAAIALAAILNEKQAIDKGRRATKTDRHGDKRLDTGQYLIDLLTGSVAGQDMKKVGKKIGGPFGSMVSEGGRALEKTLKPWEWFA